MGSGKQRDRFEDYEGFVEKFKPKKTTDDCYTPPEIMEAVNVYVADRYALDPATFVRPFWPGGDFESFEYPQDCCVVDNPPFSILARIIDFYQTRGVSFFLFAPSLTCLSGRKHLLDLNHIVPDANITYANGAVVRTGFVTNLDGDGTVLESEPRLGRILNEVDERLRNAGKVKLPRYVYPDHVITAAKAGYLAAHDTPFKVNRRDCMPIGALDAMGGRGIFGGGLLLSERAAAERAAAERAAAERAAAERAAAERAAAHVWELSDGERKLVASLG